MKPRSRPVRLLQRSTLKFGKNRDAFQGRGSWLPLCSLTIDIHALPGAASWRHFASSSIVTARLSHASRIPRKVSLSVLAGNWSSRHYTTMHASCLPSDYEKEHIKQSEALRGIHAHLLPLSESCMEYLQWIVYTELSDFFLNGHASL